MSYEGRCQVWCENGHYAEVDANDEVEDCRLCSAMPKVINCVDDTNG